MKWVYALALALAAPLYWPQLIRSFWVDEAGTYWMAYEGVAAAIEKCAHWPGQSMLYGALVSFFCLELEGPWREPLLRLPSVMGLGVTLYFTTRLAKLAIGPTAGVAAFVVLLFHPVSIGLYVQARPYGLAAAAVAGSYYFLYRWTQSQERRFLVGHAVSTLLIFYLHYLYAVALIGQAGYLMWAVAIEKRTVRWKDLAASGAAMAAALLPLAAHLRLLVKESGTLPTIGSPSYRMLASALMPQELLLGALGAGAVVYLGEVFLRRERSAPERAPQEAKALLMNWWLWGTLALFAVSRWSALKVFLPRYLGSAGPAEALMLTAAGAWVFAPRTAVIWALLTAMATTGNPLNWRTLWGIAPQEARPAIELVRTIQPNEPPPLFFQSGLIESNFLDWRQGPEGTYLFNELAAYPVANRILPLPIRLDEEVKLHVDELLAGELRQTPVVLYLGKELPDWMIGKMAARGYRLEASRPNAYLVAVFRR